MEEDGNKKEAAKIISSAATDQKEGGGSDLDVATNEGGGGDDLAMNEGGGSDVSMNESGGSDDVATNEAGRGDDDVAMNEGGTGIDSSIPKELKKRKSKEPETSSDSETSLKKLKRTSKACNRNTVSIVATSGSVSKIVLRTPNVPSPRKVHTC
ncbi:hypothetical protein P8452_22470 [Trifolium repens]|jgi:hypothetical protein|nr:hypothetical protein QL285_015582 [Trifolium repens]WJX34348.1 hypothetical protein P8452_22470 [Trifolium repens]